ncbi:hypothetical protein AD998_13430 [bacterium 336/3]|nr:hypothetical protein AD998_13430 [bacterium 336/3]
MKNRLIIFLCFTLLGKCFQSFGQESLILNSNWNKKIKENYHLSPFYYGIVKTKAQIEGDSNFVQNEILKLKKKPLKIIM